MDTRSNEEINDYIDKVNKLFKEFIDIMIVESNNTNNPIIITYYDNIYILDSYKEAFNTLLFTFIYIEDNNMVIKVSMSEFIYKIYNNQMAISINTEYIEKLNNNMIDLYDLIKDYYEYDKDTCNPITEKTYRNILNRFKGHNLTIIPNKNYKHEPVDVKSLHFANTLTI